MCHMCLFIRRFQSEAAAAAATSQKKGDKPFHQYTNPNRTITTPTTMMAILL